MTFSPTEKLLLACARTKKDDSRINPLLDKDIDWEYLIKLAKAHQILPLLYHHLRHRAIPEEIRQRFKEAYQANLIRNLRLEAGQNRIFKLLKENGIDFVPLKGTVFAELIYGDIALRQTSDIDVLVREGELFKVKELLLSNGFKRTGFSDEYYLKDSCHLVFSNGRVFVEVHWHIEPTNTAHVPSDFVWQEMYLRKIGNREIKMFSNEVLLVFFAQKFNFDSFSNLKYLIDTAEIIGNDSRTFDWSKLNELLKIFGVKNVFWLCLRLMNDLFGISIPIGFKFTSGRKWIIRSFPKEALVRNPGHKHLWRLLLLDRYREAFRLVWGYFFRSKETAFMV